MSSASGNHVRPAGIVQSVRVSSADDVVLVRVSVHEPGGRHREAETRVELATGRQIIALTRPKGSLLYQAWVAPGTYILRVDAGDLGVPDRSIDVSGTEVTASVYLGQREWPAYRLGDSIVPFEPRDDIVAVVYETRDPEPDLRSELMDRILRTLPLTPLGDDGDRETFAAEGAIWLFRLGSVDERTATMARLRALLGANARVGTVVDLAAGQVKVIDGRFIVRFRDNIKPGQVDALVEPVGWILRSRLPQAGNARVIELRGDDYRVHLDLMDDWVRQGLCIYAEPDIMFELTDDVFPTTAPNDPAWPQGNLTLQDVDDAWRYLNTNVGATSTLGSPTVYVATLDRGVQIAHPDVGGNLTDGTPQLAQCYDFRGLQACTAAGYTTDSSHGMGVFGIVAARTNNGTAVAGIAPNTHQLGLKRPIAIGNAFYADCLLWAAGFTTGNTSAGWPAEPIAPGASVISCSHGSDGMALSGLMDDTLRHLSVYGRNGRGTIVIYSAGNADQLITGFRVWAAHPRTLAIANSQMPDAIGVERRDPTSNFGPEIDICAQGTGAPSLDDMGGQQIFGGTSASAPTVAAAAALMLTAEPSLSWVAVRDLLRANAVQIDPANTDPVGQWVGGFSQWYGFGRLDADNSVQQGDGFDLGAVNLVVRDNLGDMGTMVPTGGAFWASPDIWVRASNPTGDPDPAYGVDPVGDQASFGVPNWVRVRVRNVGTGPSSSFWVRAYLTHFGGTEFRYPSDFIPSINAGDPIPSPLVQATYLLGEQASTGLSAGGVQIFTFDWPATHVPPEFVGGARWHPCLLAEVTPHTGPAPSGNLVVDYTNIGQRNVTVSYSDDDVTEAAFVMGHQDDDAPVKRLVVHRARLPKNAQLWVRFLDRRVEAAVLARLRRSEDREPRDCCSCCGRSQYVPAPSGTIVVGEERGRRVFRLAGGSRLILDVPMVAGPLTPVAVGANLPAGAGEAATYELPVLEETTDGRLRGACAVRIVVR